MARALAARAVDGGDVVELIGRDVGKVTVDIANTFTAAGSVTAVGTSGARGIASNLPRRAHVVKAFDTVFGHVLR